jgi:uncharacterized phage protein (TIGR02218 family)
MKTATWETSAGALATFLNGANQCYMADLYTFTLSGGSVLRYTSSDVPVTVNGNTFGVGPIMQRGKTRQTVGISVDTLSVSVNADASVTVNGVPLLQFIAGGGFDAAGVTLQRAFSAAPGAAWVGTLGLFSGRVSEVSTSRYGADLTINSHSEVLNVMVPRNVYQPSCMNSLYDSACGVSKASSSVSVTAAGATDAAKTLFFSTVGFTNNLYTLGFIVGVSGANAGVQRTIKSQASNYVQTIQPWPQPVSPGDTFTMYLGCDKQQATCSSKFANLVRFRGQPYVPAPESIT